MGPEITTTESTFSFASLGRELSQLFVIRSESTPSPQPEKRLERARDFLKAGQYDAAIGEVKNLPGAEAASTWIADAERYAAAMEALETLETAAVIDADRMRDGAGNPIAQPIGESDES